jgi:peptide deformylase
MGDPVLAGIAHEVQDPTAPEIHRIIDDMLATAADFGSLAGLAAPQVKIPYRIVLFTVPKEKGEEIPLTVMINPRWEALNDEMAEDWEGCLSAPGLVGRVPRYVNIRYSYQTPKGETIKVEAHGFHARVVQHECDHLDGKLYLQRMADMSHLAFTEEFIKYICHRSGTSPSS